MDKKLEQLITDIPKAENHYHLDAVSAELVWKFINRNHIDLPFRSLDEVRAIYNYHTLEEFLNVYLTAISTVLTPEDVADCLLECAADMKRQNIVYREVMFDYPACFGSRHIPFEVFAGGIEMGLREIHRQYGDLDIRFIANLDRTSPVETNIACVKEMIPWLGRIPIIAVGLDNAENGYPAYPEAAAFTLAKQNGLFLTAHCGEDCGPESILDALDSLHLDRIDHGVRAVEDPALLKRLADEKILCTLCPDSNITLGVYPDWESYPLRTLMASGVPVSISSDDPPYFTYDMTGNLLKLTETFHLTETEVITLVRNAFEYNFAGKEHLTQVDAYLSARSSSQSSDATGQ